MFPAWRPKSAAPRSTPPTEASARGPMRTEPSRPPMPCTPHTSSASSHPSADLRRERERASDCC